MIVLPRGLRETLQWIVVDLAGQRAGARMDLIERYVAFALQHDLVTEEQVRDLVEMLLNGARFPAAISELRSQGRRR
jgi:hypothetical protein